MTPAQFWALEQQNQANRQEFMQGQQENIMQGLNDIAGMYMQQENMKSSVKAGDNLLKVLGPGIGMTEDMLKQMDYGKMNVRDKYAFQQGIFNNYAVAAQTRNFGQSMGLRQQGQQIQQNAPYVAADIKNRQNIAGGNVPHGGGGGMAPVEPPLPPYSPAPVSQPPAPSANPASSIPGGDESMRRYNEWKSKRGS